MAEPMFIRLAMGDYAVERRSVPRYLRWRMRTHIPRGRPLHRVVVRELWGIGRARSSVLQSALKVAYELRVEPGWVRLKGNSQRRQLFGRSGREVVQLFFGEVPNIEREQQVRQRVGALAPRILRSCASGRGWVEEWIGRPPPEDQALQLAWRALGEHLYRPRERPLVDILDDLRPSGLAPEHRRLLRRFADLLPGSLPCSQVHGDLWLGNMGIRHKNSEARSGLVLFDWEYSREAPLSQDVWSFVFQSRQLRPEKPHSFVRDFARALGAVGRDDLAAHAGPLACLHVLDKLTWVRDLPGSRRTFEVWHLGQWLQSLTDHVMSERCA